MNRDAFFGALRARDSGLFGTSLSQRQVDGLEALLDAVTGYPLAHAAHVLAECYHETGSGMYPVKETVYRTSKDQNPSDATVIARLEGAWRAGKLPWVKTPYWREGWFGRGVIQLTHEYNYRKAQLVCGKDLVAHRELALNPGISAIIAAEGCRTGMFTGKKLADFDGPTFDHYNARAIVNGDKAANGVKVAGYAASFERALTAAGWAKPPVLPPDVEPVDPPAPKATEIPATSPIAAVFRALAALFTRR